MRKFFDSIDTDRNGWISKKDLAIGLQQLGIDRVDDVFEHLVHEDPDKIKFEEIDKAFLNFRRGPVSSPKKDQETEEDEDEDSIDTVSHDTLREFFDSIDTDEKGWVTFENLSSGLERFGVDSERIQRVMKYLDTEQEHIYFENMKEAFARLYQESKQKSTEQEEEIFETVVRSEKLESRSQNLRDQIKELRKDRDNLARRISFQNEYIQDQKLAFQQELENTRRKVETRSSSIVIHLQKELVAQRKMIVDTELELDKALSSTHSLQRDRIVS